MADKPSIDEFARHEVLHMANVLAELVDAQLVEHIAIQACPEWHKMASKAANLLHDLYQKIGEKHFS
jgi:hypothetical protein